MALDAARIVAWELDVAEKTLELSAHSDFEQLQPRLDDPSIAAQLLQQAENATGPFSADISFVKADGVVSWMRYQGRIIHDENRRPGRVLGIVQDVTELIRDITDRDRTVAQLEESRRFARRIAETTPNVLFVYDLVEQRNVYANARSMDVIGYTPKEIEEMGANFIGQLLHPDDIASLPKLAEEYARRADGEVFEHTLRMKHKNGQWRWVHRKATIFSRTPDGRPKRILGSVTDITHFKHAERELQELSARLLNIQDEERRRIARELHDVTGQNLVVIGLNLSTLNRSETLDSDARTILLECKQLCEESQSEIRTLSYLLHPPTLDPLGLVRTVEWYVDGLRKRTPIEIVLEGSRDVGRLPIELETDLFRVIQEGVTNVIRHSGSKVAVIRIAKKDDGVEVQVEDQGHGLKTDITNQNHDGSFGVGIPSMRERIRHYGGTLEILSGTEGTRLCAFAPVTSIDRGKTSGKGVGQG